MNKQIITIVVVAVVVGGLGFYGGTKYASGQRSMPGNFAGQRQGDSQQFGTGGQRNVGGGMSGFTIGEVISKDATSITVKLQDGGSKIILTSESTQVTETASSSISSIEVGEQITATGSANSDGSISAEFIQLGTLGRFWSMVGNRSPQN